MFPRFMIAAIEAAASLAVTQSAFGFGALAVDGNQGTRQGVAVNDVTPDVARANALAKCGAGCRVVVTLREYVCCIRCRPDARQPDCELGLCTGPTRAEAFALGRCERQGGMDCRVRVMLRGTAADQRVCARRARRAVRCTNPGTGGARAIDYACAAVTAAG